MIDQELDKKIADFKKLMLLEGKVIRDNENGDLIEVKIKLSECEYKWQLGTIVDYQKARSGETFIYVLLDGQSQAICVQKRN